MEVPTLIFVTAGLTSLVNLLVFVVAMNFAIKHATCLFRDYSIPNPHIEPEPEEDEVEEDEEVEDDDDDDDEEESDETDVKDRVRRQTPPFVR